MPLKDRLWAARRSAEGPHLPGIKGSGRPLSVIHELKVLVGKLPCIRRTQQARTDPLSAIPPNFELADTCLPPFDHNSAHAGPHNAATVSVSDTVTVTIDHRLGRVEAVRRLKEGFARANGHLGPMITMEQETWEGDTLRFRMRALGQTAAASIEVMDDALRIELSLPWLLAKVAKRLLSVLRKEAALLLEKK